jgi:hypothetical protein
LGKHENTKERILSGTANANIHFGDLCSLLRHMEFKERVNGSHHIFSKPGIQEIVNLQPGRDGKAKPYQVKQVRNIFKRYNLT